MPSNAQRVLAALRSAEHPLTSDELRRRARLKFADLQRALTKLDEGGFVELVIAWRVPSAK